MSASKPSHFLKAIAIGWLRFGRRMPIVCTEAGGWSADVLGVSPTSVVEVEIKTSIADMRAEFKNKIAKHYLYQNAKETSQVPNLFYFMVPADLKDKALEILAASAPKAGLIVVYDDATPYNRSTLVVKRATKLKSSPPSKQMLVQVMNRSSSELAGLYWWNVEFLRRLEDKFDAANKSIAAFAVRHASTLDIEEPTDDLDTRGRELAAAVEGVTPDKWAALPAEQKQKWLEAAIKLLEAQFSNAGEWSREAFLF